MEQLSPLDASFLYLENEHVSNHIGAIYIYDQSTVPGGRLRFRQILNYLEARIHRSPRFRQKVARWRGVNPCCRMAAMCSCDP